MGEPDSTEIDQMKRLALSALGPKRAVSASLLRETGMHREVLLQFFGALRQEIGDLVGWTPLRDVVYSARWGRRDVLYKAPKLTNSWLEKLNALDLGDQRAIMLYDGERESLPAHDYRLFLLRDGRLLHYAGGFLAGNFISEAIVCDDILTVLDELEKRYTCGFPGSWQDSRVNPFIVMMSALIGAVDRAILHRERKVKEQKKLQERLRTVIDMVSNN